MEVFITVLSLAIIAVLSGLAVFHPAYDDTLGQRVSLAGICLGALSCIPLALRNELPDQVAICSVSGAIYALSTAKKILKSYCAKP